MTRYMMIQKCIHCNKTPCEFLKGPIVELDEDGNFSEWRPTPNWEFVPSYFPQDDPGKGW